MTIYTGEQLRKIRTFKGIKQITAAQRLQITQPAYCKLEQLPAIHPERWRQIMQALSIDEPEWKQLLELIPR